MKRSNGHVEDIQIALTAVNPAPVLVKGLNTLLKNGSIGDRAAEHAGELAARTAKPLTTSALTPEYRREIVRVFTKRALLALIES
jgi:carbon-monoxide dehydrogenase medium subunit